MFKKKKSTKLPSISTSIEPPGAKTTQTTAKSKQASTASTKKTTKPSGVKTTPTTAKPTQGITASTKKTTKPADVKTTQTTPKSTQGSTASTKKATKPTGVKTPLTTPKSTQGSTASTKKAATSQKSWFKSPTTPFLRKPFDLTKPTKGQTESTTPISTPRSGSPLDKKSAGTKSTTTPKTDVSDRNKGQYETTPSTGQVPEVESASSTTPSPFISYKKIRYETFDELDGIPSKIPDPVPAETKRNIVEITNGFIIEQTILESKASKEGLRARTQERQMRYEMRKSKIEELQKHPFFQRMMRSVVDQWLEESKHTKRYKGNERYKDTVASKGRIQPRVCHYILEYGIRFNKLPWVHPGKNRIQTKIYDKVDFVDKPFVITEEKTEREVKHQTVKTEKSARRQSW